LSTTDPIVSRHAAQAPVRGTSRFVRACLRQPVDRTPVWFLRQAGRYMPEYMAVRRHHSLLEICRTPAIASEVTITAADRLGVDAAIIFADLLLPFTPMGLDFEFVNGEGPVVRKPVRSLAHVEAPRGPFTLASYMIEGGSSRNYIDTKRLMYASSDATSAENAAWPLLMEKLISVLTEYAQQQVDAGADVIQVFDSWAGALSVPDYRAYCLAPTTELIRRIQAMGVPVIYFGVDTASLLPTFRETGADVLGLDWRVPLAEGWKLAGDNVAVQGNLDPITLFAPEVVLEERVRAILAQAARRSGHIFNLGHGIVPGTPVENVLKVVEMVKQHG
jgi:uroporphyrinogen decarboxylase